jgi:hypothetical protein
LQWAGWVQQPDEGAAASLYQTLAQVPPMLYGFGASIAAMIAVSLLTKQPMPDDEQPTTQQL